MNIESTENVSQDLEQYARNEARRFLKHIIEEELQRLNATACNQQTDTRAKTGNDFGLSPREMEVLDLLVNGFSNQQIADHLVLSPETIKSHMRHIMEKLGVHDRTQAALKAVRFSLVPGGGLDTQTCHGSTRES